ncbi:F-box/kelch-repeat protein At3g23880-like isoform X2 [Cynara cardunculus var. scolymus]|uniref:F-box/kelch-repeat protein At3g23880-like isoform X2 n=1 Tax=Cynara cardunculus var. scolymus TaxID=59895 RepID=UPI000D627CED|nr:F-box/kelch-repeat protein At3g23880-like isoform X2 [Cynara cardunculus var. scolymus]
MSRPSHFIFNLPQDVIFDILSRLPTKSLIQFRSVCTSSPPLISHPSFTKLHLSSPAVDAADHHLLIYYESTDYIHQFYSLRSPITFQETLKFQIPYKHLHGYLRIVGSSKGLICFFDTNYYSNVGRIFEFKIVVIAYYFDSLKLNCVLVYSLSTNSWKKLEDLIAPCYLIKGWSSNVFVNGSVNWLASKDAIRGVSHTIMAFDLDDERFRVLELPKNVVPNYDQVCLASSMNGECLSLCAHYLGGNGDKWDVWAMSDYGVVDSWKKVCVVSQPGLSIPPLLIRDDDEILVVMNDGRLMLYNVVKGEMRDLETCGLARTFRAVSYTASLALLHG